VTTPGAVLWRPGLIVEPNPSCSEQTSIECTGDAAQDCY
jgi:hypothetical protein